MMPFIFSKSTLPEYCDLLAGKDGRIQQIIDTVGYPPYWERRTDFEGLVRIILEQQVSLASAFSVYHKLKKIIDPITPQKLIRLSDEELKSCGFSRQKSSYVRILADEILSNGLDLNKLKTKSDHDIREQLIKIKGIGHWTCDVYLLLGLKRLDLFPTGDLALIKSMSENGFIHAKPSKEEVLQVADQFKPCRSIFAFILWHAYIVRHRIKVV